MKTLIVYYSFTQNNELLAKMIQTRLGCDLLKIETTKKRSPFSIVLDTIFGRKPAIRKHNLTIEDYDQLVFIAPIWIGKIAGPLKTFLREEKTRIKRYSFITLCGGNAGQKEKIESELVAILGMRPEKVSELWVSMIIGTTKDAKNMAAYRAKPSDLEKFRAPIDEFCDVVQREMVS